MSTLGGNVAGRRWPGVHLHVALGAGAAIVLCCLAWLIIGLSHEWSHPFIGWLPMPLSALLAADMCRRVNRHSGELAAPTRRFWRDMGGACLLVAAATTFNAFDAVGGARPAQGLGEPALACYLGVFVLALWAFVRLPSWQRTRGEWARFGLDVCVILITLGVFLWHFALSRLALWTAQTGSAVPALVVVGMSLVSVLVFAKFAFTGTGQPDRWSMHILSAGIAVSAACGSLTPLLVDKPYLTMSFAATPIAAFTVQLAAYRQYRSPAAKPPVRTGHRRFSVVPYLAVAATDTLLLVGDQTRSTEAWIVEFSAVALTVAVVVRQITALRDNGRLLNTVDNSLTQLQGYQEQLSHQATHDALTGIANRTLFEQHLTDDLRAGEPFSVALLDLDNFKIINDRLGHGAGDILLTAVSQRLREHVREHDIVARLGGDEFIILLPRTSQHEATEVLRRLIAVVRQPIMLGGYDVLVEVSIGVTQSRAADSPEEIIRRADVAMYAAKGAGGSRWTCFDPVMDSLADEAARLDADLRQAITRGELFLMYQPIVTLPDGRLTGVEALLRWRHPVHGLVSPDVFIPLAERSGFIVELGRWVLEQVCRQTVTWQCRYGEHAPGKVGVNISARQLQEPAFVAEFAEVLHRTGVDARRLMVEVTETAVLNTGSALDAIRDLHALGLPVALDDFGTGHSSLSLLVTCPVDVLKVDKSFVSGVTDDSPQAVIVNGLIGITDGLRIQAVAEGVETAAQAEELHRAGYRLAQGFHFARPTTSDGIDALLDDAAGIRTGDHVSPAAS